MDKYHLLWVGSKCGQHGPYTFYRSFEFTKNSMSRVMSLGDFFFIRCSENDPVCIAELQLLWEDKTTEGIMLSSLRLYFLPEHTPDGRHHSHGDDEVIAVSSKVIMNIEDLLGWVIMEEVRWIDGFPTICCLTEDCSSRNGNGLFQAAVSSSNTDNAEACSSSPENNCTGKMQASIRDEEDRVNFVHDSGLDIKEKLSNPSQRGFELKNQEEKVMVVSYPNYCRYHANVRRIGKEGEKWRSNPLIKALGLLPLPHHHTKLLFCRDEFDHPMLEDDERLCEYTAPKLKGRPRKKSVKFKSDSNDGYESPARQSSVKNSKKFLLASRKPEQMESCWINRRNHPTISRGDSLTKLTAEVRKGRLVSEELFLTHLYKYMKDRNTPIERIPNLGFKQIDLFMFFELAIQYGGYKRITAQKLWKVIYDKMGGNPNSTSAATCTRKHYERLLFPFEQYLRLQGKVSSHLSEGREKKRNKEKKEKKKSRVKHVREQLQELEAKRAAERKAQEELQQVAVVGMEQQSCLEKSVSYVSAAAITTVTNSTATSAVASTSAGFQSEMKPPMTINGTPIMAVPTMMPPTSMVQLPGNTQFFPHVGLKNMGPVILAIPQIPIIAAASGPKSEPEIPEIGQQVDQNPPLSPVVATVLDKIGAGMSLLQQRNNVDVPKESMTSKADVAHVSSQFLERKENKTLQRLMQTEGIIPKDPSLVSSNSSQANRMKVVNKESLAPRPSVIKHTEHAKVMSEYNIQTGANKSQSQYLLGVQPNNLISENKNKKQDSVDESHSSKEVAGIPNLLGTGAPFMSPYIPFLPQAPFLLQPRVELPNVSVGQGISANHSLNYPNQGAPDLCPPVPKIQPLQLSTAMPATLPSIKDKQMPIQDEPCDLSLPKKRRRDVVEESGSREKYLDSIRNLTSDHSAHSTIRNSPVHRLRTSDKKVHRHSSPNAHLKEYHGTTKSVTSSSSSSYSCLPMTSSAPPISRVKMTPNPRGSITQGVINSTKTSTHSIHPVRRDKLDSSEALSPKSVHDLAPSPHLLPVSVDSSGKTLASAGDLSHLTRFPVMPYSYYPLIPRPPFLPLRTPCFPTGLAPGIPTTQVESMLQGGLLFRPPFPFAPTVPYSTAQLSVDSQHTSLYRK